MAQQLGRGFRDEAILENTQTAPSGSRYLLKEPSQPREGEAPVTGPR